MLSNKGGGAMNSLPANEEIGKEFILTEEIFFKISNGDNKAFA